MCHRNTTRMFGIGGDSFMSTPAEFKFDFYTGPMRIFPRYILKEVLAHGAIGIAVFTFVLFMGQVGKIMEVVVRNSAPLPSVAEVFFLGLPTALKFSIPMGVLVGILIGLSRLAADSEVTAMRA